MRLLTRESFDFDAVRSYARRDLWDLAVSLGLVPKKSYSRTKIGHMINIAINGIPGFDPKVCGTYTVRQLRQFSRQIGLPTRGTKKELCKRLRFVFDCEIPHSQVKKQQGNVFNYKRCDPVTYTKKQLLDLFDKYGLRAPRKATKKDLCAVLTRMSSCNINVGKNYHNFKNISDDVIVVGKVEDTAPVVSVKTKAEEEGAGGAVVEKEEDRVDDRAAPEFPSVPPGLEPVSIGDVTPTGGEPGLVGEEDGVGLDMEEEEEEQQEDDGLVVRGGEDEVRADIDAAKGEEEDLRARDLDSLHSMYKNILKEIKMNKKMLDARYDEMMRRVKRNSRALAEDGDDDEKTKGDGEWRAREGENDHLIRSYNAYAKDMRQRNNKMLVSAKQLDEIIEEKIRASAASGAAGGGGGGGGGNINYIHFVNDSMRDHREQFYPPPPPAYAGRPRYDPYAVMEDVRIGERMRADLAREAERMRRDAEVPAPVKRPPPYVPPPPRPAERKEEKEEKVLVEEEKRKEKKVLEEEKEKVLGEEKKKEETEADRLERKRVEIERVSDLLEEEAEEEEAEKEAQMKRDLALMRAEEAAAEREEDLLEAQVQRDIAREFADEKDVDEQQAERALAAAKREVPAEIERELAEEERIERKIKTPPPPLPTLAVQPPPARLVIPPRDVPARMRPMGADQTKAELPPRPQRPAVAFEKPDRIKEEEGDALAPPFRLPVRRRRLPPVAVLPKAEEKEAAPPARAPRIGGPRPPAAAAAAVAPARVAAIPPRRLAERRAKEAAAARAKKEEARHVLEKKRQEFVIKQKQQEERARRFRDLQLGRRSAAQVPAADAARVRQMIREFKFDDDGRRPAPAVQPVAARRFAAAGAVVPPAPPAPRPARLRAQAARVTLPPMAARRRVAARGPAAVADVAAQIARERQAEARAEEQLLRRDADRRQRMTARWAEEQARRTRMERDRAAEARARARPARPVGIKDRDVVAEPKARPALEPVRMKQPPAAAPVRAVAKREEEDTAADRVRARVRGRAGEADVQTDMDRVRALTDPDLPKSLLKEERNAVAESDAHEERVDLLAGDIAGARQEIARLEQRRARARSPDERLSLDMQVADKMSELASLEADMRVMDEETRRLDAQFTATQTRAHVERAMVLLDKIRRRLGDSFKKADVRGLLGEVFRRAHAPAIGRALRAVDPNVDPEALLVDLLGGRRASKSTRETVRRAVADNLDLEQMILLLIGLYRIYLFVPKSVRETRGLVDMIKKLGDAIYRKAPAAAARLEMPPLEALTEVDEEKESEVSVPPAARPTVIPTPSPDGTRAPTRAPAPSVRPAEKDTDIPIAPETPRPAPAPPAPQEKPTVSPRPPVARRLVFDKPSPPTPSAPTPRPPPRGLAARRKVAAELPSPPVPSPVPPPRGLAARRRKRIPGAVPSPAPAPVPMFPAAREEEEEPDVPLPPLEPVTPSDVGLEMIGERALPPPPPETSRFVRLFSKTPIALYPINYA